MLDKTSEDFVGAFNREKVQESCKLHINNSIDVKLRTPTILTTVSAAVGGEVEQRGCSHILHS